MASTVGGVGVGVGCVEEGDLILASTGFCPLLLQLRPNEKKY